jgi:hypothetical protein
MLVRELIERLEKYPEYEVTIEVVAPEESTEERLGTRVANIGDVIVFPASENIYPEVMLCEAITDEEMERYAAKQVMREIEQRIDELKAWPEFKQRIKELEAELEAEREVQP